MKKGIIGAGNWIVDHIKTIDRWPGEGNLCNIISQEQAGGGGACNVLFDLAAMTKQIPLYAAGKVGNDNAGDFLLTEIKKRNINSEYMLQSSNAPTSYTDVMSGEGKRTFFHNRGANDLLDFDDLNSIDIDAKIFYLGYLLLLGKLDSDDPEYGTVAARLLESMQKKNYHTVVDFVSEAPEKFARVVKSAIPYINTLVINEIEAGNTFNIAIRQSDNSLNYSNMENVAKLFMSAGLQNLIVIHYPEGAYALEKSGKTCFMPSCDVKKSEIVGTNGAGDAFCAGILYGIHENLSLEDSLKIASKSAAFNLKSPSASGGAVSIEKFF